MTRAPPPRDYLAEVGVTVLAFSPDMTQVAYSPNNHLIHIATIGTADCATWNVTTTLKGHEQSVSGIDWSPATGAICSCAHDRTAFVWHRSGSEWVQVLVMVDATIKRGLTSIKWAPSGKKLYIGSASANLGVAKLGGEGYWVCAVTEPHQSSITCVAAHPTIDALVATGSTDGFLKVLSTYNKSVDGASSPITAKLGTELYVVRTGTAWVNSIAFSPSGTTIAVATHDSRMHLCQGPAAENFESGWICRTISFAFLPIRSVAFYKEDAFVGAGHDYFPIVFRRTGDTWKATDKGVIVNDPTLTKQVSAAELARRKFADAVSLGQQSTTDAAVDTRHKNTITMVVPFLDTSSPFQFATASLDGRVELWAESTLAAI